MESDVLTILVIFPEIFLCTVVYHSSLCDD